MASDEAPNDAQTRGPAAEHDDAPTFWTSGSAQPMHIQPAHAAEESTSTSARRGGSSVRWMMAGLGVVILGCGAFLVGQNMTGSQGEHQAGPTSVAVNSQTTPAMSEQTASPSDGYEESPAPATADEPHESSNSPQTSVQSSSPSESTSTTSSDYVAPFPADTVTTCGDDSASAVHELSPIGLDYVRTQAGTNSGCNLVRDIAGKVSERVAADPNVSQMTFTARTTRSQANIANKNPNYAISCTRENHLAFCQGGVRIRVYVQR